MNELVWLLIFVGLAVIVAVALEKIRRASGIPRWIRLLSTVILAVILFFLVFAVALQIIYIITLYLR